MNYRRATLVGMMLLGGSLVVVDLTASAVQMAAIHAENKRVAAWQTEQRREAAFTQARMSNLVEASLSN
jgi:hypothetical protein